MITFVAGSARNTIASGNIDLSRPAGVQAGDVVVASIAVRFGSGAVTTVPSGFVEVADANGQVGAFGEQRSWIKVLGASEPTSYTFTVTGSGQRNGTIVAYRGVDNATPLAAADVTTYGAPTSTATAPSVTTEVDGCLVLRIFSMQGNTGSITGIGTGRANSSDVLRVIDAAQATAGATGTVNATISNDEAIAATVALQPTNDVPNAPALVSPTGNEVRERSEGITFRWTHSDPDGDAQTDAELRYRTGDAAWTTVPSLGSDSEYVMPGGTLTAGQWEWQARTSDAEGFGPWSSSAFFMAADRPVAPTITAPADSATVTAVEGTVTLTHADTPTAMQIRVVDASDGTVYFDSGSVAWATSLTDDLYPSASNGQTVDVEARVLADGLWSPWDTASNILVEYTAPATPTLTVTANVADQPTAGTPSGIYLVVTPTNPAPTGDQPTVTSIDVLRQQSLDGGTTWTSTENGDPGDADAYNTIASDLEPDAAYVDPEVASDVPYRYAVVARASSNQTSSQSAWTE